MLAYILALAVGLGSFALYMAAFFFPEVHRKNDFLWSGVGLFYALVLWCCAGQITGAVLLSQVACVALLGWLGWQMLRLRRSLTPTDLQTPVSVESLTESTTQTFAQIKIKLRRGSWLKAIPALVTSLKQLFQDGFSDSSENRLSRLARSRSIRQRKLKRRYEYEFVEDTPRDRRVQAAVAASLEKEPSDEAVTPETTDLPEVMIAPTLVDAAVCPSLGQDAPDRTIGMREAMDTSGESIASEPAAVLSEPRGAVELSNLSNIEESVEESTPEESKAAELPHSAAAPPESSAKHLPKQVFQKAIIIKDWMQELIASLNQPKPKYSMIELPPRPPSIPRHIAELREVAKDEEDEFETVLEELDLIEKPKPGLDESLSTDIADDLSTDIADDFENPEAVSEAVLDSDLSSDSDLGIEAEVIEVSIRANHDKRVEASVDTELSGDAAVDDTGDVSKAPRSA